jgi:hypothetical protein
MINLLPPIIKADLVYARRNAILRWYVLLTIAAAGLIGALLLSGIWYASRQVTSVESDLASAQARLSAYEDTETEAASLRDTLGAVQELFEQQADYLAVLRDIERATLPSAQLQALTLSGDDTKPLGLEFTVPSETAAASLRISLENSDRFSFVDIEGINRVEDSGFTVSYKLAFEAGRAR